MRQAQTKMLHSHWRELSRRGAPPDRNDLDPCAIAGALQDVFILGLGPDGEWRYRVAGTRLSAYADRDVRGEIFTAWWRPEDRLDVSRLLKTTAEDKAPVVGGVSGLGARGERHNLEFILLPLQHGGRDGLRMAGGLFPAAATARIYDVRLSELSVLSLRSLDDPAPAAEPFGQARADIDQLVERRAGLRLIEGGRA
jgi:hypothetical protein